MQIRLTRPESNVYRDEEPPPGLDLHRGQTDEGRFVCTVATVAGEIDSEFLAAIFDFVGRVNEQRGRRPVLTLLSSSAPSSERSVG